MLDLEEKTRKNKGVEVFFAASYGGRDEIVSAVKKISEELSKKEIAKMTEKKFESFLFSSPISDPEIIIRTGGDTRLSNFLL
jgi:undecaprenyl diphosphate synthase